MNTGDNRVYTVTGYSLIVLGGLLILLEIVVGPRAYSEAPVTGWSGVVGCIGVGLVWIGVGLWYLRG